MSRLVLSMAESNPYQPPAAQSSAEETRRYLLLPTAVLRGIGIVSILLAALGLLYNGVYFFADFGSITKDLPYFHQAFYALSAISILCYAFLIASGIQFIRLKTRAVWPFVVFEVIFFFAVGLLWLLPSIGPSIAAATGVAIGGMMFQGLLLFPIWAIPACLWAGHHSTRAE